MRYVIVCLLKNEVLKFHKELVEEVCLKLKVKPQKLPAHFTIKAPFETDKIKEVESIIGEFTKTNSAKEMNINGFGSFRDNVVYMKIEASKEATKLHNNFIEELEKIPWLSFKEYDGKDKVFHCTIVSRLSKNSFCNVLEYVNKFHPKFKFLFDNITIMRWDKDSWVVHKEYLF